MQGGCGRISKGGPGKHSAVDVTFLQDKERHGSLSRNGK